MDKSSGAHHTFTTVYSGHLYTALLLKQPKTCLLQAISIFNMRQSYCARYSYRLDVCLSVRLNGSTYHQTVFTAW